MKWHSHAQNVSLEKFLKGQFISLTELCTELNTLLKKAETDIHFLLKVVCNEHYQIQRRFLSFPTWTVLIIAKISMEPLHSKQILFMSTSKISIFRSTKFLTTADWGLNFS